MGNEIDARALFEAKRFDHAKVAANFELPVDHPAVGKIAVIVAASSFFAEDDAELSRLRADIARLTAARDAAIQRAEKAERAIQIALDLMQTTAGKAAAAKQLHIALVEACEGG